jgi:hypothetical protein
MFPLCYGRLAVIPKWPECDSELAGRKFRFGRCLAAMTSMSLRPGPCVDGFWRSLQVQNRSVRPDHRRTHTRNLLHPAEGATFCCPSNPDRRCGGRHERRFLAQKLPRCYRRGRRSFGEDPTGAEIRCVREALENNSWWPSGDQQARRLFVFALRVGINIVVPLFDNQQGVTVCRLPVELVLGTNGHCIEDIRILPGLDHVKRLDTVRDSSWSHE